MVTIYVATKNFMLLILWQLKVFYHHTNGDQKHSITNRMATDFFSIVTHMAIESFYSISQLSGWRRIDLPIDLTTKFGGLVIKANHVIWTHFLFWIAWALCCLISNHFHILIKEIKLVLGREAWNLYRCLNFRSLYCINNWRWIFIVSLKVEFNFILNYLNYSVQTFFFVYLMEGRWNVWNPCYLMVEDKLGKVECKFYNNVISYRMDRMLFHLGYQYDGNRWNGIIMCSKGTSMGEGPIFLMWRTCPFTTKPHGSYWPIS